MAHPLYGYSHSKLKKVMSLKIMNRVQFLLLGICYKLIQSFRRSEADASANLAVYANDDLGLRISCFGEFESEILDCVRKRLGDSFGHSIFLDIGANVGNHTNGLAGSFFHCHSFEPDPRNFQLLKLNTAGNARITCHKVAVSDRRGRSLLQQDFTNSGKSRIVKETAHSNSEHRTKLISVRAEKLDALFNDADEIGLLKIDVEGHEENVLRGAKKLLKKHKPIIMLELLPSQIVSGRAKALDYLSELGYTSFEEIKVSTVQMHLLLWRPALKWVNLVIVAMQILIFGKPKATISKLNISSLKPKIYEAILVSE